MTEEKPLFESATAETIDARRYLLANPDLRRAFGNDEAKALQHYYDYGFKENRKQVTAAFLSSQPEEFTKFKGSLPSMLREPFASSLPSHQASVDLFEGSWFSKMPEGSGLVGGQAEHFTDSRVPWAAKVLGGLASKSILELGPFEAYNTSQFESMGAASVVAIEGSSANFLKCLIIKNIMGLKTTFLYGDFTKYLETTKNRFDICWASGVLYHLTRPIEFLEGISSVSDTLFLWTQYYDTGIMMTHPDAPIFHEETNKTVEYHGRQLILHGREYHERDGTGLFSGGPEAMSYWMELEDILHVLRCHGFNRIEMGVNNLHHPPGPACFFLAFR